MHKCNPLVHAVNAHETLADLHGEIMFQIGGDAAFEPFDSELSDAVAQTIENASNAIDQLSPRARHARLSLIWRDFVKEQKKKREVKSE